ncbi:aldo/keto reductase [uncultured Pseudoramibacter sp.]|uniref:aldo/keto reductase n=1 Tax=uncultured Pseudoramibacter sp. TaxID=1623493 RepID=UPI0025D73710|nr:aldo/keto reductase [uncultured Pseudoramibacter sp.]
MQKTEWAQDIPKLGFGLMRLPGTQGGGKADLETVTKMVDAFMDAGLRYFDTAYVYDKGGSEKTAKQVLVDRYPRESFMLASKLHATIGVNSAEEAKRELAVSLERTGAGYFDFYLLHSLMLTNYQKYEDYGLWDFVKAQKAAGKIRHIGFSFHGTPELLEKLLTDHPEAEFVQLQINYADWDNPAVASRQCYDIARRFGKPIVIMEPVKGGFLAQPPASVQQILTEANPDVSAASWAIRFAASLPGVITVLSGMSDEAQMADNLSYMTHFEPLSESEQAVIRKAQAAIAAIDAIPCTGCRYCVAGCPKHIPIPNIFSAMNREMVYGQTSDAKRRYANATAGAGKASDCIACGQCERACPQHLPIIADLQNCAAALED